MRRGAFSGVHPPCCQELAVSKSVPQARHSRTKSFRKARAARDNPIQPKFTLLEAKPGTRDVQSVCWRESRENACKLGAARRKLNRSFLNAAKVVSHGGRRRVKKIVEDMGKRVGLLEFRPACKGPFGRCKIVKWKKEKDK